MSNRNPNLKKIAERLVAHEKASGKSAGDDGASALRICERLRVSLSKLMGEAGYRSLLSRAIALAGADVPWLRGLHIQADGTLEGLAELKPKLNDEQLKLGEVALVAELLGLMATFVGAALTLQLIRQSSPEADVSEFEF